jgi:uracil-DNA glycosylase
MATKRDLLFDFPEGWKNELNECRPNIEEIADALADKDWIPEDVYAALRHVPLQKVRVVIVGQDPYTQVVSIDDENYTRATGYAFSQRRGDKVSASLMNVFKELQDTVSGFVTPDHGDLTSWCDQGVLLLNMCLTVDRKGQSASHGRLWEDVVYKLIKALTRHKDDVIYLLWGKKAQLVAKWVDSKGTILTAAHPSPTSASGFFGCDHFNQVNAILTARNQEPIYWPIDQ